MGRLEIYIAFGHRRGSDPVHWMIMLRAPDSTKSTWYHVTGGPSKGTNYELVIQNNKRFKTFSVSDHCYVGGINEQDQNKVKAAAKKVPAQRCQEWTVEVLRNLEKKGLVPVGTRDYWFDRIEASPYSTDGVHGLAGSSGPQWLWDEGQQDYRYWDEGSGGWVWASESN
ncbi:hypothetical protein BKA56DRAFT_676330 [Ilyonectria sp. MPI-CAGE-AT-0026]|nr:hypothetical protein BKA56DRAFT_676330 [Ilyonectria sp. MPI-CAGE-AT-0026]